ncbi:PQQ-binding-like beta-propeller repeat protein [Pseudooceanicola spongiae]|uniref:PQQ-binding-like beta-propeller repeat protein n=1 Tax=Pseudooceanicola spongiae TaxID=2613965 RepID=A0A7L9WJ11_9RHOB|nr:PQQ-binding-like beta-propeller repeat protein [Pseudooceanicola spongiae]
MAKAVTNLSGLLAGTAVRPLLGGKSARLVSLGLLAGLALAGCTEREVLLSGPREPLRSVMSEQVPGDLDTLPVNRSAPISLPGARTNADWPQSAGSPASRTTNAALSGAPQLIWSAAIGQGDERKARITSDPVVAGGRIYTIDSGATVTATALNGQTLWSTNLVPAQDAPGSASGGGVAYANGKVFVASGYGTLTALDASTGAQIWQQKLLASATGAPGVYGDLVYVTSGADQAWAVDQNNGRVRWQLSATPNVNNLAGAPTPAVTDQYVLFGFGSGEVQTAFRQGGMRVWDALISGRRAGFARSNINSITGDPVVEGDTVYAGNQSGRTVALNLSSGERLWTADEGPMNPVWPAGGSVFLVSDQSELVRLNASTGERIWGVKLPFFVKDKPKKQEAIFAHYGPILAGGRLVVASSDDLLRFFDPVSGALVNTVALPGGAASAPVVAGGVLYVLSKDGKLLAYR